MNNRKIGSISSDNPEYRGTGNLLVSRFTGHVSRCMASVLSIHIYTTILAILFVILFCSPAIADDNSLTLINDNKSSYVIAVPSNASGSVMDAANDLAYHFKKISGVEIPIINEPQIPKIDTVIYIGYCNVTNEALPLSALPPASYVLRSSGNRIYLYGDDTVLDEKYKVERTGTYSAVSMLLEKYLKCRWLMSGELGESIPCQSTVTLSPLNEVHTPTFPVHNIWLDRTDPDEVKWARRMRMGVSFIFDGGHAFEDWYAAYGKKNPEWFALQNNMTREPIAPKKAHLCVSNLEIDKIWFHGAYQLFNKRPYQYSASASFNDAGAEGFCLCKYCRDMDPQDAPMGIYFYGKGYPHGEKIKMSSITDRNMSFVNRLANVLNYQWPGKLVSYTAYRNGITPPVAVKPLPNVLVFFAGFSYVDERCRSLSREYFDGWRNLTEKIIVRPNILHHGAAMPLDYSRKLAADVHYCAEKNIYGFTYDGIPRNWGSSGINYYILAKMLDNPQFQYKDLFDEYCGRMYGEASSDMKTYYQELELFTNKIALSGNSNGIQSGWGWHIPDYYNEDEINKFCGILNRAKECTKDGKVIERIDLCLMSWEYARRLRDVCAATRKHGDKDAAKDEMRRLDEWRSKITGAGGKAVDTRKDTWRWSCIRTAVEPSGFWEQIENESLLPQEY